ncbi:phosphatase PAP2 family protein [Deinococcus sonorensis]|uniref:Phosphatase PAP2 family protein n=2 Tax=Deinococcus sonorensis TaxID=309891 RepID=A0AAU7UDZ7_9DEIO
MTVWLRTHWRPLLALALLIVLPLLLLGSIAEDVHEREPFVWEAPLMVSFRGSAPGWFLAVARVLSTVGSAHVMLPFCVVLLLVLWRKSRTIATYFLISVGGAVLLNVLLKTFFVRARPHVVPWLWEEGDSSFPSGHSSMAAALVVTLTALLWRTPYRWASGLLGLIYVVLMGLSRIYLGVHYPTDVLGGWALGLAWAGGVALVLWPRLRRAQQHAATPGTFPHDPPIEAGPQSGGQTGS